MRILIGGMILSVFSAACGFLGATGDVVVSWPAGGLPIYKGANPPSWEVRWLNSSGTVSKRVIGSTQGSFVLELPKESSLVVMAAPVTAEYAGLYHVRPAGAVVGVDSPLPETLQLSWEDGFSAQFLLSLVDAGVPLYTINQRRFAASARERSGNRPWNLDERRLRVDIAERKLRTYSFRLLEEFTVEVALPEGIWYPQFPLDPPLISNQIGWRGVLPMGVWHFANPIGTRTATISVDGGGRVFLQIVD